MLKIRLYRRQLLLFFLVLSSLVPNIGLKFTTFGFVWTFYRIVVLVSVLIYFQMEKTHRAKISRIEHRRWVILLLFWILYGFILLIISPYRNQHSGLVELLSIFSGLICIYIIGGSVCRKEDVEIIVKTCHLVYIALIIIGVLEIFTGKHLNMSIFMDNRHIYELEYIRGATGNFYGVNDFAAFLTAFVPILFFYKKHILLNRICFLGVIYINYVNDANICILALLIGIVYYIVFLRQYSVKQSRILRSCIILILVFTCGVMFFCLPELANKNNLLYVFETQIKNFAASKGSLWSRLTIYKDSIKAAIDSCFIGVGPAAFTNYLASFSSESGLSNPHNMYLEILVEYGGVIALAFVGLLFQMLYKLRKRIWRCDDKEYRRKLCIVFEMVLLYSIVCIAPSSFIGYSWQWIVISISVIMLDMPEAFLRKK